MTVETAPALTPIQVAVLRRFSIVSGFEAGHFDMTDADCEPLVDLAYLSMTGKPRRYRLTHAGYLATYIPSDNPAT